MTKPRYEQCWDKHDPIGSLGYPTYEQLEANPRAAHMSVHTCGRTECVESANRAIRDVTGHDGIFRPFPGKSKRPIEQTTLFSGVTS